MNITVCYGGDTVKNTFLKKIHISIILVDNLLIVLFVVGILYG
jgi:hypothetical protein